MSNIIHDLSWREKTLYSMQSHGLSMSGWIGQNYFYYVDRAKIHAIDTSTFVGKSVNLRENVRSTGSSGNILYALTENYFSVISFCSEGGVIDRYPVDKEMAKQSFIVIYNDNVYVVLRSGKVYAWNNFIFRHVFDIGRQDVSCVCFVDNDIIVYGTDSGRIGLYGLRVEGEHECRQHSDKITSLVHASGVLFASSRDGSVSCWNIGTDVNFVNLHHSNSLYFLNLIVPHGNGLLIGDSGGNLVKFNISDGEFRSPQKIHNDSIRSMALSPDQSLLLTSSDDGVIKIWNMQTLKCVRKWGKRREYIRSGTIIGNYIVFGTSSGRLISVSVSDGAENVIYFTRSIRAVIKFGISDVVVGCDDGRIFLLDTTSNSALWSVKFNAGVFSICESDDGSIIAGLRDGCIVKICAKNGCLVGKIDVHTSLVGDVISHGSNIVSCSDDGMVKFTHFNSKRTIKTVDPVGLAVNNLFINRRRLFCGTDNGSILVIDASDKTLVSEYNIHSAPIRALFCFDNFIVTGGRDGSVIVQDTESMSVVTSASYGARICWIGFSGIDGCIVIITEQEVVLVNSDFNVLNKNIVQIKPKDRDENSFTTVVHISDPHFGTGSSDSLLCTQLADDLSHGLKLDRIDGIIVSGDIASFATPEEYEVARSFFKTLRTEFLGETGQILIVPGNHDVSWAATRSAYRPHRKGESDGMVNTIHSFENGSYIERADCAEIIKKFDNFSAFYKVITGNNYPKSFDDQFDFIRIGGIVFWGINSSWAIDHNFKNRALVNDNVLSTILNKIRTEKMHAFKHVLVLHHPIGGGLDGSIENGAVIQQLEKAGFKAIMHGHIHKPVAQQFRSTHFSVNKNIDVIAAGTFGAPVRDWCPGYPLQYNVIKFHPDHAKVYSRRREDVFGAWMPDARWFHDSDSDPRSWYEIKF